LQEIAVGGEGGWDYLAADAGARRLYVSHATKVEVIDLDKESVVGEIADTPGVHGVAIADELGRLFVSDGKENKAAIVDAKTLKTLSKVETGTNPDAILYNPKQQEVYTFNGRSASSTVFDGKSGKVVATIPLGGKPEFAAVDPAAGRVYDTIEDKSEVVAIDAKTHTIVKHWPIAPGEAGSGLAIDLAHHRIFVGCDNQLIVMLDSESGKVVGSVPIGDGVDAVAFDPGTQMVFASCGDGTTTIAHEDAPDKLTPVQTLTTEKGARTMALDAKTHRIYLSSAQFQPLPPNAPPHTWRKAVSGTFKVLVYGN
jgi:DNA-binding beta-propeller fold protein YncE